MPSIFVPRDVILKAARSLEKEPMEGYFFTGDLTDPQTSHYTMPGTQSKNDLSTGTKYDNDKPQMDLLSPIFLLGVSRVLTFGAKKYAAHNWRKGLLLSRCFAALMRHLWAFWMGEDIDKESGFPHLDCAGCELMFLRELWETRPDLDDRFKGEKKI